MNKNILVLLMLLSISGCSIPSINKDNLVKTSSSAAGGYVGYHLSDGDFQPLLAQQLAL